MGDVRLATYMLVPYTISLTMSTTMALVVCVVVFKWAHVLRHPSQGALFYFFACTALWSAVTFVGCIAKYLNHRTESWNNALTKYTFLVAQIFQVGAALWLIIAVYEIKRMVFNPRSLRNSQRMMRWLTLGVFAVLGAYGLGLLLFVTLKWGTGRFKVNTNTTLGRRRDRNSTAYFKRESELNFFHALRWAHSLVRMVSVVFPIAMSGYFYWRRHDGGERGQISHRQVQLIGLLNSLATVPICLMDTGHYDNLGVVVQLAQFFYYLSGTVSAFAVGLFLPRFDQLSKTTPRNSLAPASVSLLGSPAATDIYILETNR
ncbi:hypothetical protein ACHHYP_12743 [Achlya hypogyna]|uniref:Uncharacterized protein n=1 Tax=Achlya hypogyna TaxID=1202772 RepID=A0A1V9ZGH7_ACHHY|nr:hypothetical protein ACHHYP_12743 [Achlya hypogyna]